MDQMPVISLPRSRTEQWHDWLSIAAIAGASAYMLVRWSGLPSTIPIHYSVSGEPDGWGGKWVLFLLPPIAIAMFALMTWIRNRPHQFNYPVQVTEQNAPRLYLLMRQMLSWIKLEIAVLLSYVQWAAVRGAEQHYPVSGITLLIIALVVILGTIFGYAFRFSR